jgi:manganese/zinc/iron transport system substrate-binding protein
MKTAYNVIWTMFLGLLVMAVAGGCTVAEDDAGERPRVVATTTMIGDLVRQIGGEHVRLVVIMGPGVDPHMYRPRPSDLAEIRRAERVFYNGFHLEGRMVELLERQLGERAVAVTRGIPQERLIPWAEDGYGAYDPHVWFDVSLWMMSAETVRDELIAILPEHREELESNAGQLLERMEALHRYVQEQVDSLPEERRVLITSHDAFNYFGRQYGVDVRGIQGLSTDAEPGQAQVLAAVRFIVETRVPAMFVETSVNPRIIERVQSDVRSRGHEVRIGGELYSDAMGAPGEQEGYEVETYEGMMRYNVDTFVAAMRE